MANSARRLAVQQIQTANSGHPGAALGVADIMTTVYANHLRFDPKNPNWPGRDRFVLSMGHASALLYSVLHLAGYDISAKDLKNFRKIGSKTPGHPEVGIPGVEATTGPLGQGFAMGVGMAIAARKDKIDNHTYVLCSDGDLMEGVAQEAISIAGLQKLNRLIVLWDDNNITIDGVAQNIENQVKRFQAAQWNAVSVDGHDPAAIDAAITAAKKSDRPTLIACRTKIGYGSKLEGDAKSHGSPFSHDEAVRLMEKLAAQSDDTLWEKVRSKKEEGRRKEDKKSPFIIPVPKVEKFESTRKIGQAVIEHFMKKYPARVIGASADVAGSTSVLTAATKILNPKNPAGNFIEFGVREFGMAAVMNGIMLAGTKTFSSTYLAFSDYMRPAIRMAAMMQIPQIFVFSHDSIGVGEDGETHQPIEQLASLRAIPNLNVFRPASAAEVAFAWEYALNSRTRPSAIITSRQKIMLAPDAPFVGKIARGGYVISDVKGKRHVTIIATGSEVPLAISAAKLLAAKKINAAVVSMPCAELFRAQTQEFRDKTLCPETSLVVSVEAGTTAAWREFADVAIGINEYGLSGSADALMAHFGFTASKIAERIVKELC